MKAYVITHVSSFEPRAEAVGSWLQSQGAEVTWVCPDFDHMQGKTVNRKKQDHVYLHLPPYKRHLSLQRIRSIQTFSLEVERYLTGKKIDLLYVMIPANSLVPVAEKVKAETGAAVVVDILDLWPESLPLERLKKLSPARVWGDLRDKHLACADLIFTECSLYQEVLALPKEKTHTLYWFGQKPAESFSAEHAVDARDPESLQIAYEGAINHIIDIPSIRRVLTALQKRCAVTVHVIGDGENTDALLKAITESGVGYHYYGAVYDPKKKAEILSGCAAGLNMMIPQVRVGLTMKSLDYLAHGLPLLNTIPGDTWALVEQYDAGVNIDKDKPEAAVDAILALAKDRHASEDAIRLFEEQFTEKRFFATLDEKLMPFLAGRGLVSARGSKQAEKKLASSVIRKQKPAISVAMVVRNGENYLAEQLDSILTQLGSGDEVIASVDPSEDGSFAKLCEYAAKDSRIRVTEGPGQGVVKNVEHALRQCTGEKIFLADQDDIWLPEKISKVSKSLDYATLVLHDAKIVDEALNELEPSFMAWRGSRKGILSNVWKNSYIGCCMAFRRELLEYILPFPQDLPMHDQWIGLMAEKHGKVRLLRVPLLLYRRHIGTVTDGTHAGVRQMLKWRAHITREVVKR